MDEAEVATEPVAATRYRPPPGAIAWLMRALALVALAVSAVLVYESSRGSGLPGCGEGSGCDEVLNSPWSKVGPVPTALLAVNVYAVMLVAMFFLKRRVAWSLLLACATAAIGAAGWFTYVQFALVGTLCKYCLTVHVCGGAAGLLVWINGPVGRSRVMPDDEPDPAMVPPREAGVLALIGVLGVVAVAGTQVVFPAPSTRVTLLEGMVQFDPHLFPVVGDADAPVVLAELYDYTCPYCRQLELMLRSARQRYGDQFVVVALPVPLEADCNPNVVVTEPRHEHACALARLALAVWRADPSKFEAMHEWLFDEQRGMTVEKATAYAAELVGQAALDANLDDPSIAERFLTNAKLHDHLTGGLPQLLTPTVRIQGKPPEQDELFRILEEHTALRPERLQSEP